ncbi:MAG TPA: DUF389 domain-containing protein [Streptosporangiaceae bacterium]|jgi:uncharacterized hydrophobic protein (TIGR00271 family)|nr:DUF389 domain-containing protein [Streptosporangiaceae bacterium]
MLHVRVASPANQTAQVVSLLADSPGVVNLVVLPGAAREPAGDAVQFDLSTASANAVLRQLRALRPPGAGPIAIEAVDAAIGAGDLDRPRHDGGGGGIFQGETAPVWDLVESKIAADSVYAPSWYILLALAGVIGAVGIMINSTILIVSAMVVGPEYSAIIAVAMGIERHDRTAIWRGLRALVVGFAIAIVVTFVFSVFIRLIGQVPDAYRDGLRPVSDFINSPDLFSVIIAVVAGIIGVVSLTEARAGALIGVFISVTTIPAAADIGLSVAFQSWRAARGSTFQLLLNVVLLILVGAVALRVQRLVWRDRGPAS